MFSFGRGTGPRFGTLKSVWSFGKEYIAVGNLGFGEIRLKLTFSRRLVYDNSEVRWSLKRHLVFRPKIEEYVEQNCDDKKDFTAYLFQGEIQFGKKTVTRLAQLKHHKFYPLLLIFVLPWKRLKLLFIFLQQFYTMRLYSLLSWPLPYQQFCWCNCSIEVVLFCSTHNFLPDTMIYIRCLVAW